MKWCRFQTGQQVSYGIVEDDRVVEVTGSPFADHTVTRTSYALGQENSCPPLFPRCSTPPAPTVVPLLM